MLTYLQPLIIAGDQIQDLVYNRCSNTELHTKALNFATEFLKIRIIPYICWSENTEQWSSCHNAVYRASILNLPTQIHSQKALISDSLGLLIISISRYEIQTMMNLVTYFAPLKY